MTNLGLYFTSYRVWLMTVLVIFIFAFFTKGSTAFLAVSFLVGYPHLFFTGYYLKKEKANFILPLLAFTLFALIVSLDTALILVVYLYLQPLHYNYQNWLLTTAKKNYQSGLFWLGIGSFHIIFVHAVISGKILGFEVITLVGIFFLLFSHYVLHIDRKTLFVGSLFIAMISAMKTKESLLAIATGWHGAQYILNILNENKIEKRVGLQFFIIMILVACSYSLFATVYVSQARQWAVVLVLSSNFTHYLFDFIVLGRDYLRNDSKSKSLYY